MNGALGALFDGQGCDFKSTSRLPCLRTRRSLADVLKVPLVRAASRKRRSFPIRSSLDDASGISQEENLDFRQELVEFAKTAQKMMDPTPFHNAVTPEARSAMKFTISRMLGSVSHQFFDIRYSSLTEQCKTLMLSMQISGYMIKNAQDRMELATRIEWADDGFEKHAKTHHVQGDVIRWKVDGGPKSIPAVDYIATLENEIQELKERERKRFEHGDSHRLVDYMKELDNKRLEELANGASEEVLLSMHVCTEEFLGSDDPETGPMTCSLPQKEMFRLMEWLMTFGYNLRCKEIQYEMERAFDMAIKGS